MFLFVRVGHQIYRAYARARVSVRTLVCKLECKSRMAAAAPPPPPETAWCSRARGALDIARGALGAGGGVNSIHPRASGTNRRRRSLHSRAPRRWRHRGRSGATGAQVLVHACERLTSDGRRVVDAHVRASRTDWCRRRRQDCLLPPIPAI